MTNKPILEACVETVEQAVLAEKCGADRIELCANLEVGGLTPSLTLLKESISSVSIPIMAMVRPRSGDFVYSIRELTEMRKTIDLLKEVGVKGAVFGFLKKSNEVDVDLALQLTEYSQPLEVTFHKAIDLTPDPIRSAKEIAQIPGIQRVLSSGGKNTAEEGMDTLKKMQESVGNDLIVLVGGKVTLQNLKSLHSIIGAKEYHGKRIVF